MARTASNRLTWAGYELYNQPRGPICVKKKGHKCSCNKWISILVPTWVISQAQLHITRVTVHAYPNGSPIKQNITAASPF